MQRTTRLTLLSVVLGLAAGCGREPDVLDLEFLDELVEAPARSIQAAVVVDADCETLLSVPHAELESVATVHTRRSGTYPVDPDLGLFSEAPRGRALAVDVAVKGRDDLVISRSCATTTLSPDAPTTVTLPMHGLPPCESEPTILDLAIVLDTSTGMRNANIGLGGELTDRLSTFVQNLGIPGGSVRFSVIVHGHLDAQEVLPPTADRQVVLQSIESLRGVAEGEAVHYAGLRAAAAHLKDRALCGHRPAILWIGGGPDTSDASTFDIATIEVVGTRGEPYDDIFVYAIGVSADAISAMRLLVDRVNLASIEGALTGDRLTSALDNARFGFQSLFP